MSDYFSAPVPGAASAPGSTPPRSAPAGWPPPAHGYAPAPTGPPGWPAYAPASSETSGLLKALIVVSIVVGTIIVMGILAAIAIPVFLEQRAKSEAAATTVAIPDQLLDLTRLHDARAVQLEQQLRSQPGNPEAGVYGVAGSVRATVSVKRQRMSSGDERDFMTGAESSFQNQGVGHVIFSDADPGRLGGFMRCATVSSPTFSVCLFADHGAYGSITLFGDRAGRDDVAVSVREAVEHRP